VALTFEIFIINLKEKLSREMEEGSKMKGRGYWNILFQGLL
jgi:hypothetical protein